jgi:hypothetical protein
MKNVRAQMNRNLSKLRRVFKNFKAKGVENSRMIKMVSVGEISGSILSLFSSFSFYFKLIIVSVWRRLKTVNIILSAK